MDERVEMMIDESWKLFDLDLSGMMVFFDNGAISLSDIAEDEKTKEIEKDTEYMEKLMVKLSHAVIA